ncbi:E3 ubiquitin/ISG15 ligase TRIM25-like [Poecilia reticulata]|uniref:E3 ubiquitin/ISG15 ligase TRIM25-like n=1 Tax=Poecilia reticulata TaxID=8081 RepID=UPI0007EB11F8|nr:PREDICTED: E3 ubiquitin/ISG15 ligase TRIM25-like [Poecilia reticulata]
MFCFHIQPGLCEGSADMAAQDQPLCCICLDVFTQPVALPCQHHFCWTCITKHWDNADRCQCPLCNRRLTSRPELQVNAGMSGLSDQLELLAQQTACCSLEPQPDAGQVVCSVCTNKAQMSCLVCLSSYCETHQVFHQMIPGLKRHTQLDPVEGQEDRMCNKYQKASEKLMCRCGLFVDTQDLR